MHTALEHILQVTFSLPISYAWLHCGQWESNSVEELRLITGALRSNAPPGVSEMDDRNVISSIEKRCFSNGIFRAGLRAGLVRCKVALLVLGATSSSEWSELLE